MVNRWSSPAVLGLSLVLATGCPEPDDDGGTWGDWYGETGDTGGDSTDGGGVETGQDDRRPPETGDDDDGDATDGDETAGDETEGDGDGDDPNQCLDRLLPDGTLDTIIFDNTIGRTDDSLGSCGIGAAPDVEIGFVAPADGLYVFDTTGSGFDTVVYVREGECGEELACNDDFIGLESRVVVDLARDQLVTVVVDGAGPFEEGPVELYIGEAVPVSCDVTKINGALPQQVAGDTTNAADDFESGCGGDGAPDQVFEFSAPGPGTYHFDTFGSDFDTVLYTLDGCDGAPIVCSDDANFQLQSELSADLFGGEKLLLVVDGHDANDFGDFVLNVEVL